MENAALIEAKKVEIKATLKTRKHKFVDNEGDVADKLTLEFDFSKVTCQPDQDFEERLKEVCTEWIAEHIQGLWDNSHDEQH